MQCASVVISAAIVGLSAAAAAQPVPPVVKTERCVSLSQIQETSVLDDQTIIFKMRGGKSYKNTLPYKCPQLGFEKAFSYKTSISQLCNVDIITVLTTTHGLDSGASCGLGLFEPYTPPPKAKK